MAVSHGTGGLYFKGLCPTDKNVQRKGGFILRRSYVVLDIAVFKMNRKQKALPTWHYRPWTGGADGWGRGHWEEPPRPLPSWAAGRPALHQRSALTGLVPLGLCTGGGLSPLLLSQLFQRGHLLNQTLFSVPSVPRKSHLLSLSEDLHMTDYGAFSCGILKVLQ